MKIHIITTSPTISATKSGQTRPLYMRINKQNKDPVVEYNSKDDNDDNDLINHTPKYYSKYT